LLLRKALDEADQVDLRLQAKVTAVEPLAKGGYAITYQQDGQDFTETFTDVVNATWYARLPLDRPLGISPPGPWSHRYKYGHQIHTPVPGGFPSLTIVLGPFGDMVDFGERGVFASWYPVGRTGMTSEESPPDWDVLYTTDERYDNFFASYEELVKRYRVLDKTPSREQVDPSGGVIYALGTTDVDDQQSYLHMRDEIGIQSKDRYHSVDTGKYTMVPYWAMKVADKVLDS
jgi:hypothetical protein